DSNGPALAVAAAAAGADVVHVARASDDPAALVAALDALPEVDLVVTSGGVSMGAYDVVKAALAPLGITFEQVAVQPGKPQAWGRLRGGPAFLGLPGNPVSSLVCFELFGRAALGSERPILRTQLLDAVERSHAGVRQLRRGRLEPGGVRLEGGPASHLVAGLARADCLVVVPEDATTLSAGAWVDVIAL
ncbi:MAG TPA: molybdopterin-binding protein, partial [Mycobacteriales bacterium]